MGLSVGDIYSAIQLMLAPVYVNDFFYGGRVKRVTMQADAPFRIGPDALATSTRRASRDDGAERQRSAMIPLSNVVQTKWTRARPR